MFRVSRDGGWGFSDVSDPGSGGGVRMTFSEERLRQLFAEFKLDLVEMLSKKASLEAHELLAHRVTQLELWQAAQVATEGTRESISARQVVLWGFALALFAAVVAGVKLALGVL